MWLELWLWLELLLRLGLWLGPWCEQGDGIWGAGDGGVRRFDGGRLMVFGSY